MLRFEAEAALSFPSLLAGTAPSRLSKAFVACLLLTPWFAMADWVDEMPTIDEVARAVREQNRQDASTYRASGGLGSVNGINPGPRRVSADDQDWYAARLAGTLRMLRWHMQFEALRERNPTSPSPWLPLWPPRQSTLARAEKIAADYRQMELLLRAGTGKRPSYNKRLCDARDSFLNRFGQKMYTQEECYREVFDRDADLEHIFTYRQAIFPRLFCGSGEHYHNRYQEFFIDDGTRGQRGPWDRPHNYVFKKINNENWPAIASPQTAAQACAAHGGDTDDDGICDAWEVALQNPAAEAPGKCLVCPDPEAQSSTKPASTIDDAVRAAKPVALANTLQNGQEWGAYIYPVAGGFRFQNAVTSHNSTEIDTAIVVDPKFERLFPGRDLKSCRPVAFYHTHPDRGFWLGGGNQMDQSGVVPGLSIADFRWAIGHKMPVYVVDGNSERIYVYEPGKSADADEFLMSVDPSTGPFMQRVYNLRYSRRR